MIRLGTFFKRRSNEKPTEVDSSSAADTVVMPTLSINIDGLVQQQTGLALDDRAESGFNPYNNSQISAF